MDRERLIEIDSVGPHGRDDLPAELQRVDYTSCCDGLHDWALVRRPASGTAPMVVVLHGHGSGGDQLWVRQDLREKRWPFFEQSDFGIVSPNLRGNAWMGPAAAADLSGLVAVMLEHWGARPVILDGGSMGGTGALIFSVLYPEVVSAVVALCPATELAFYHRWCRDEPHEKAVVGEIADAIEAAYGGTPDDQPELYHRHSALGRAYRLSMPVYLAHGTEDDVIPFEQSAMVADALHRDGIATLAPVPEGGHDAALELMPAGLAWVRGALSAGAG
ncbi:MAG: alpha/beta hydrolase family protein [Planctomycetota bacterium]